MVFLHSAIIPMAQYAKFLDPYKKNASKRWNDLKIFLADFLKQCGFFSNESQPESNQVLFPVWKHECPLSGYKTVRAQGPCLIYLRVPEAPCFAQWECRMLSEGTNCSGLEQEFSVVGGQRKGVAMLWAWREAWF